MADPDLSVTESWTRIVDWLGRHAPATASTIAPPASAVTLRRVESSFPAPWPDDLREWYGLHDGAPMTELWQGVLPMSSVLSLEDMAAAVAALNTDGSGDRSAADANENAFAFLAQYVPIGEDGCGSTLYVDLRPGEHHGCVAEYDGGGGDTDTADPFWPSVAAMLADVADCLERSRPVLGWLVPAVEDGHLSWNDVEELA